MHATYQVMAFLACRSGPRESELLDRLGADGKPHIELSFRQPPSPRRFYLVDHGYTLPVDIIRFTEEEALRWREALNSDGRDGHP